MPMVATENPTEMITGAIKTGFPEILPQGAASHPQETSIGILVADLTSEVRAEGISVLAVEEVLMVVVGTLMTIMKVHIRALPEAKPHDAQQVSLAHYIEVHKL